MSSDNKNLNNTATIKLKPGDLILCKNVNKYKEDMVLLLVCVNDRTMEYNIDSILYEINVMTIYSKYPSEFNNTALLKIWKGKPSFFAKQDNMDYVWEKLKENKCPLY